MPSKSRHSHRKKSFKAGGKGAAVTAQPSAVTAARPVAGETFKSTSLPRTATPAAAVTQYPFIKKELALTGILAAITLIIMVILYVLHV